MSGRSIDRTKQQEQQNTDREQRLTVAQVAARLQVSEKTVRNHILQGRLQATRVGRAIRISEAALRAYDSDGRICPRGHRADRVLSGAPVSG